MKKVIIASIITFTLAAVVLVSATGIENVLAQQPGKSSLDNAIASISDAETQTVPETERAPVPENIVELLSDLVN